MSFIKMIAITFANDDYVTHTEDKSKPLFLNATLVNDKLLEVDLYKEKEGKAYVELLYPLYNVRHIEIIPLEE